MNKDSIGFRIVDRAEGTSARTGVLTTPGASIETPVFMPVGTRATVKTMTPDEISSMGYRIILNNTYHLFLRPGDGLIKKMGGLRKFSSWPHAILTDSGGYQVFSLSVLRKITEEGVIFQSHIDGKRIMLTPINDDITGREPYNGYLIYQGGVPEVEEFIKRYRK